MDMRSQELIEEEIARLVDLGWANSAPTRLGVRIIDSHHNLDISFPQSLFDNDRERFDLDGIWVRWRVRKILDTLNENGVKILWEVGSGDGNVAIPLSSAGIGVIGIEPLLQGAVITSQNGIRTYVGTLESLNLPSNSLYAVGVFDVLEHLEKPKDLLAEIYRVLKPGGICLVTVPAHEWLFSNFDANIGHYRRYSRKNLLWSLDGAGFRSNYSQFLFSLFVLPAWVLRKLSKNAKRDSDLKKSISSSQQYFYLLKVLEPVLKPLLFVEECFRFPFGLSLFSVSKK